MTTALALDLELVWMPAIAGGSVAPFCAFQNDAFQNNAFQVCGAGGGGAGTSFYIPIWRPRRR